jgi:hypothetical protein
MSRAESLTQSQTNALNSYSLGFAVTFGLIIAAVIITLFQYPGDINGLRAPVLSFHSVGRGVINNDTHQVTATEVHVGILDKSPESPMSSTGPWPIDQPAPSPLPAYFQISSTQDERQGDEKQAKTTKEYSTNIDGFGNSSNSSNSYLFTGTLTPALSPGPCKPDTTFRGRDWYADYASRVRKVRPFPSCPECIRSEAKSVWSMADACPRWWHATPQRIYADLPFRKWNEERLRPQKHVFSEVRPCKDFGQKSVPPGKCSASFQKLFDALDRVRAVYFPRSGTELGIVRGSTLLSADGDLDIYVDMPQRKLLEALKKELSPEPKLNGNEKTAEVHWFAQSGCPTVHMVYNDWISGELQHTDTVAADLCRCKMDSVELFCHRDGVKRMYTQYGPSWNVSLGIKQVDMPGWAQSHKSHSWVVSMRKKLKSLVAGKTGVIETVEGTDDPMALAQLNVLFDHIQ